MHALFSQALRLSVRVLLCSVAGGSLAGCGVAMVQDIHVNSDLSGTIEAWFRPTSDLLGILIDDTLENVSADEKLVAEEAQNTSADFRRAEALLSPGAAAITVFETMKLSGINVHHILVQCADMKRLRKIPSWPRDRDGNKEGVASLPAFQSVLMRTYFEGIYNGLRGIDVRRNNEGVVAIRIHADSILWWDGEQQHKRLIVPDGYYAFTKEQKRRLIAQRYDKVLWFKDFFVDSDYARLETSVLFRLYLPRKPLVTRRFRYGDLQDFEYVWKP